MASALHLRPTWPAAQPPWAPGSPDPTTLLFCQFAVRLPVAHVGRKRVRAPFSSGGTGLCLLHAPLSPDGNQCRGHLGMHILGKDPLSCWGLPGLAAHLRGRGEKTQGRLECHLSPPPASASPRETKCLPQASSSSPGDRSGYYRRATPQGKKSPHRSSWVGACGHQKGPAVLLPLPPLPAAGLAGEAKGAGRGGQVGGRAYL